MDWRTWAIIVVSVVLGVLLIGFEVHLESRRPPLAGQFPLGDGGEAVSGHRLERDFRDRLARAGFVPRSVTCREDLRASIGSSVRCDARFRKNWKSGTPEAERTSSGWLADRADYAVTQIGDRTAEFAITPGLSADLLENALAQELTTATYLQCPEDGIAGVAGTTVSCQANYGYPDGPCSDPIFGDTGRRSATPRRCTLQVGVQRVSGLSLDLAILRVTPPA